MADQDIIHLRGMTWNHTRGYTPMAATAQRFNELHPHVHISWEKRSLQAFGDQPIDELAKAYDLLVIDHPFVGYAARSGVLLAVDDYLTREYLADQAGNSVGRSHESYGFGGKHWALAIDAATPVAAFRSDLMLRAGMPVPKTWEELMILGRRGLVCCPCVPIDTYCTFIGLCASAGAALFPDEQIVVPREQGRDAMERLRQLASITPARFYELNPIRTLELMSQTDDYAYCPYTYGYSNYARPGYAPKVVHFGDVVQLAPGRAGSTMLGGTGLAVSAGCKHQQIAMKYAEFVAAPQTQRGIFFQSGGQPGHRSAWVDEGINAVSSNYFRDTLPMLDRAFLRPRYAGYLGFQDHAGDPIQQFMREGGNADHVLDVLDALYRAHRMI